MRRDSTVLEQLAAKCLTFVYRRAVLVVRSLDGPPPDFRPGVAVELAELGAEEIDEYRRLRPGQSPAEILGRLERGDRCFLSRVAGGTIAHAGWVAVGRGPVPYLRAEISLEPGDLYVYDSYASPGLRGRGLAPAWHAHVCRLGQSQGMRRVAGIVAVENRPGRRVLAKLGYTPAGVYRLVRLGPWSIRSQRALGAGPVLPLVPGGRRGGAAYRGH